MGKRGAEPRFNPNSALTRAPYRFAAGELKADELRVDSLLDRPSEYYALNGNDKQCKGLEHKIRSDFTAASQLLTRLNLAGLRHQTQSEFIAFKQAVTGGQFESVARKKMDSNGAILSESAVLGFTFISKLDEAYFAAFPVRMNPIWKLWTASRRA